MFKAATTIEPASAVPNIQTESPETGSLSIRLGVTFGVISLVAIIAMAVAVCKRKVKW